MTEFSTQEFEKKKNEKLEEKLAKIKIAQQEGEAQVRAASLGLTYIDLTRTPIEKDALILIPEKKALANKTIAFYLIKDALKVGSVDPKSKNTQDLIKEIEDQTGYKITQFLISEPSFQHAVKVYRQIVTPQKKEEVGISEEALKEAGTQIKDLEQLKKRIKEVSTSEQVSIILAGAITAGASDIHIEPEEEKILLRYRIDGILHDIAELPRDIYKQLMSRIKLIAGLKINITEKPQDGRITVSVEGKEIDLRISTLPAAYGESVVMRLLGTGSTGLKITGLGFRKNEEKLLLDLIKRPTGMILTTGPTGSGKTTTLYSFINQIKSSEIKIITLENPIEIRMDGIQQTPIDPEKDMTFASGLRAILRQDPDVVMVGEIRDLETAEIASQAALTGHLVFSTLHTNDAAGAIPRLINMGVKPFTLGPALTGVIGQRLVRRICPNCHKEYQPDQETIKMLKKELGKHYPKAGVEKLYKPGDKCKVCGDLGYKGRIGIYEVIEVTKGIQNLINVRASNLDIFNQAVKDGMVTMRQDGLLKAIEGVTTLEEVDRVS